MGKKIPSCAIRAVIFPYCSPGSFANIRSPTSPEEWFPFRFAKPATLCCFTGQHGSNRFSASFSYLPGSWQSFEDINAHTSPLGLGAAAVVFHVKERRAIPHFHLRRWARLQNNYLIRFLFAIQNCIAKFSMRIDFGGRSFVVWR